MPSSLQTEPSAPDRRIPEDVVFEVRGITKVYLQGEVEVHALRGIDLRLQQGEFIVLLGHSGIGKSTLLNIMGGLDVPTTGTVHYRGRDITDFSEHELTYYRREHVGFVFQFYNLIPSLTAAENVALVTDVAEDPMAPEDALALVGLDHRLDHFPSQMSGGEQQRVAIARAIAKRPQVLLCDEPTGALDVGTGIAVLEAIDTVNRQLGTTTAVITHNAVIAGMASTELFRSLTDESPRSKSTAAANRRPISVGEMTAINRKLLRDLGAMKGQAIAIGAVVACGIAVFVMARATLRSLETAKNAYYAENRFADIFTSLVRAPTGLIHRVASIDGVAAVDHRVVEAMTLDIPTLANPPPGRRSRYRFGRVAA